MPDSSIQDGRIARVCLDCAVRSFNASRDRTMLDGTISVGEMLPGKMGERAITHRLAVCLERALAESGIVAPSSAIVVDCEYNLHEADPKALAFEDEQFVDVVKAARRSVDETEGYYSVSVFPDIVVHERRSDRNDLLIVEVKRRRRSPDEDDDPALSAYDDLKLRLFTRPKAKSRDYGYQFGCAVLAIDCGPRRVLRIGQTYQGGNAIEWTPT